MPREGRYEWPGAKTTGTDCGWDIRPLGAGSRVVASIVADFEAISETGFIHYFYGDAINGSAYSEVAAPRQWTEYHTENSEASETQAAPGREKRSRRHPWILTIDPPMHNDGAASQAASHCIKSRPLRPFSRSGLSPAKHHRDRFSDAIQNTSFPSPDPDMEETSDPLQAARPAPDFCPSSFQVIFTPMLCEYIHCRANAYKSALWSGGWVARGGMTMLKKDADTSATSSQVSCSIK
ncbi:hypothetical protein BBK36DRAFT_1190417 [Trichoderma citrinoviride]|uniref:Uncharacterized protein n=1 Tax=Trichoderma citrinoviride TaxID=58853 RepID=A0A2T4AXK4_9HYPO|nr:hypothetical protein BBK36DRAFT_1190417 [Trichoderma citrinoviride]PTB61805.1 hypothetical protein BBK36DRAFT_1190417 [Trichoderma citrinoviride]